MKKRKQTKMNDFGWCGEEGCYTKKASDSRRALQLSFVPTGYSRRPFNSMVNVP